MPFPAIVGIPWLAGFLGTMFTSIVGYLVQFVTMRLARVAAAIALLTIVTTAFFAALKAVMETVYVLTPPWVEAAFYFLPDNSLVCVSAYYTALTLRWSYDWTTKIVQLKLF